MYSRNSLRTWSALYHHRAVARQRLTRGSVKSLHRIGINLVMFYFRVLGCSVHNHCSFIDESGHVKWNLLINNFIWLLSLENWLPAELYQTANSQGLLVSRLHLIIRFQCLVVILVSIPTRAQLQAYKLIIAYWNLLFGGFSWQNASPKTGSMRYKSIIVFLLHLKATRRKYWLNARTRLFVI